MAGISHTFALLKFSLECDTMDTKGDVERINTMSLLTDRIEVNPAVMLGKPVIRGTRILVELIIRKLSEGATQADLLDAYPHLTQADIRHCCATGCDFAVVRALRAEGYDVLAVSEVMRRSDDRELIDQASREKRILLTEDKDLPAGLCQSCRLGRCYPDPLPR
jgi:uncharacterized protein (DUF433 family)